MSTVYYQIPRNSLLWILMAQSMAMAPHLQHLPLWVLLAWAITLLWRAQIYRGVWTYPNLPIKVVLIVLCVGGLLNQYQRFFGLEPMLGLLVTAFLLKLLEMQRRRDALIVIYLGYFLSATVFLLFQTALMTVYVFLCVILFTTALIGMNQYRGVQYPWYSFKLASKLLLQSIPMMLVLFLLMPRLGSLWAVPQQQHGARTGVSETMSPGDFSQLAQDDSIAFRVTFSGEIPPPAKRYWRGLTLSNFDGRKWEPTRYDQYRGVRSADRRQAAIEDWQQRVLPVGEVYEYDIMLEPTFRYWLYVMPMVDPSANEHIYTREFSIVQRAPIRKRYQYSVSSYADYRWDVNGLSQRGRQRELSLPPSSNPQTVAQARAWKNQSTDDRAYINRVLQYFNQQFTYTLEPPTLGEHSADEFLWQTQRGFCEHFSNAFVVMMRAAGIPSRVVVGYQGGEINSVNNVLVVRNSDAHAWAEVWLEDEGWIRVDPTAAVAPERIESGLRDALNEEEAGQLGELFSANSRIPILFRLRNQLDAIEYNWHRWVLSYDQDSQSALLRRLLGDVTPLRFALALLGCGVFLFGLIGLTLFLSGRSRIKDPGERAFRKFLRRLNAKGIAIEVGEGPRTLAERVADQAPELGPWVRHVVKNYERYAYEGKVESLPSLRKAVLLKI